MDPPPTPPEAVAMTSTPWAADVEIEMTEQSKQAAAATQPSNSGSRKSLSMCGILSLVLLLVVAGASIATLVLLVGDKSPNEGYTVNVNINGLPVTNPATGGGTTSPAEASAPPSSAIALSAEAGSAFLNTPNVCQAKKPINGFENTDCLVDGVVAVAEQAGANVTKGYVGELEVGERTPITVPYWQQGLCPVNVHWHLGAEHLSVGQFDEAGSSPISTGSRKLLAAAEVREGLLCHHYDEANEIFTKEFDWQHCVDMEVGQTYEVHWPHSAAGACGTINQFQTPFYDGVFCTDGVISLDPLNTFEKIGVQAQVFTIVNDEQYYYPDLMRGMIVNGDMGLDMAYYTGSTTGTSRDNEICSVYTPISWQVDRTCHLISASTFDKMCADMKAQRDDMSDDLHAHGSRELVADILTANNQQDK